MAQDRGTCIAVFLSAAVVILGVLGSLVLGMHYGSKQPRITIKYWATRSFALVHFSACTGHSFARSALLASLVRPDAPICMLAH